MLVVAVVIGVVGHKCLLGEYIDAARVYVNLKRDRVIVSHHEASQ
jgi:hypothetical protein